MSDTVLWICVGLIFVVMAFATGTKIGSCDKKTILTNLCYETNGKYDFCVEKKQWEVK